MTEGNEGAPPRRMVRCPEGHIFDAAPHDDCPTCGARAPAASPPEPAPVALAEKASQHSSSPSRRLILIAAAGAVFIALVAALMLRSEPTDKPLGGIPSQAANKHDQQTKKVTPSIVGSWALDVPMPQGGLAHWTIEFDRDGRYIFSDPTNGATHEGTYQAKDGAWSINGTWTRNPILPSGTAYTDGGNFSLPTADSLELQGRAGSAVWRRVR
ncbi:MAG: hypothetical protein R3C60_11745 [Parvularculaceae bacterium]